MKVYQKYILFFGIIGSLILALIFLVKQSEKKYNWNTYNLEYNDMQPYGFSALKSTLKNSYKTTLFKEKFAISALLQSKEPTDYIATGDYLTYRKKELDTLYDFVKRGNRIFLAYNDISDTVLLRFGIFAQLASFRTNSIPKINVFLQSNNILDSNFFRVGVKENYKDEIAISWNYFNEKSLNKTFDKQAINLFESTEKIDDSTTIDESADTEEVFIDENYFFGNDFLNGVTPVLNHENLAYIDKKEQVIMVKYKIGAGEVILLHNPILLSNYFFSEDKLFNLPIQLLKVLDNDRCLVDIEARNFKINSFGVKSSQSPLKYILSKKWFKMSLYSLLIIAAVFIFFTSFRRLRVISIYQTPQNKSITTIKNIAAMLYTANNHTTLINYMKTSFEYWKAQQSTNALNNLAGTAKEAFDVCNFISNKDIWEKEQFSKFKKNFNYLKSIYAK